MSADPMPPAWRFDVGRLARLALRHRSWLLKVNGAAAVLVVVVVLLLPRWYTSGVTLMPGQRDGLALDLGGTGVGLGAGAILTGQQSTPQDQLRIVLQSRAVADSLVRAFHLRERWGIPYMDRARKRLAECTTITTPKEGQVVIEVEARTPRLAFELAAAYARYAAQESGRLKRSLAGQRRVYLEARLGELDRELARAGGRLRAFEESHRAVSLPDQARATLEADGELLGQLAVLETELAATRRYFTESSPEVLALRDRAGELRRQLQRLQRDGADLLPGGGALPALKQEYLGLAREQASLLAVSEALRRLYEQARVEEANPVPTFSILDDATLPERASRPPRTLTVLLSMALVLAGSLLHLQGRAGAAERAAAGRGAAAGAPPSELDPARRAAA